MKARRAVSRPGALWLLVLRLRGFADLPMRVAHVITRMIIGGAQENTLFNCLDLKHFHGDEVLLATGPATGPEGDLLDQGRAGGLAIEIVPELQRAIHPARDWRAYAAIKKCLRAFRPDVVHTHSAKGGMLGRLAGRALRVPAVVHTVHGAPFHPYQPWAARTFFRWCEWFAARRCHALISVADAMTEQLVAAGVAPRRKFTTIYSGMEVEPFLRANEHRARTRAALGFAEEHVVVGKIARLFPLKGHEDVIAAARRIVPTFPNARFLWVGDGVLAEPLRRQIAAAGLTDHFCFTGLAPPERIPEYVGAMDVLVHASLREGLARALPQALLAGKPVVSFDVDGAREVVLPGETGYLIRPRDVPSLADALRALLADAPLRARLGAAGQARFRDQFRHQEMTRRIRALYERVLAESAGRPGDHAEEAT